MPLDDLQTVQDLVSEQAETVRSLVLARKSTDADETPQPDLEQPLEYGEVELRQKLADDIEEVIRDAVASALQDIENDEKRTEFREYQASNVNTDIPVVQEIGIGEVPAAETITNSVQADNLDPTTYGAGRRPDFQAIRVEDRGGRTAIAFQKFTNRQVLGRRGKVSMLLDQDEGEYEPFEGELLEVPDKVDAIAYEDTLFIFNQKRFEDIFEFYVQIEDHASEVIESLREGDLRISNFDRFEDAVFDNRRVERKLYEVTEIGLYNDITTDQAVEIIDEFDLDLEVGENEEGESEIRMPNKLKVWEVLHILNDDYLESTQTENLYRAAGKERQGQD